MLVFGLLVGLGLVMASLERTTVMKHWETRRCDLSVMMAARFFKPDSDPRAPGEFSSDNFEFCTKSFVEKFMAVFMAPMSVVLGKEANVTSGLMDIVNNARTMASTMYSAFSSYLSTYFQKFHGSIFQMNRVIQQLRMAVQRMSAIAMSTIYMGLSLFSGMISSIQVVIRVIIIICAIMIAILILLFFILFPFIPFIIKTLTALVTIVIALTGMISPSIAADAESKKSGFCLAPGTRVRMFDGTQKRVEEVELHDRLEGGGTVTNRLVLSGDDVPLFDLCGVTVSGSHLVEHLGSWIAVEQHPNAVPCDPLLHEKVLYCFNVTSNIIPVECPRDGITRLFRDWEEMDEKDTVAHQEWTELILRLLNGTPSTLSPSPSEVTMFDGEIRIETPQGLRAIKDISIGDHVLSVDGTSTVVLGIVSGFDGTGMVYEYQHGKWIYHRVSAFETPYMGYHLITASGTFVAFSTDAQRHLLRDFTEVGHDRIHETYAYVAHRLRLSKNISHVQ